ncbi:hypothetical protein QCA50_006439 [Cerrena zonata]|uniref:RRM domain-containing protein n=1 Tax=Cerrena zonata TaxID=2478898 RepID=A0AAW0GL34_9APHY
MSAYTVYVSDLSPTTTEQHLNDFFTFCGKISSISFDAAAHAATIHFEKPQAAKTAIMLNGGTLDGTHISVTSESVHLEGEEKREAETHDGTYRQEDKPKAGIAAEYLAKGYKLSDHILQRAIEYDTKQGISNKFLTYFQSLDTTIGAKALGPEKTVTGKIQETLSQAQVRAKTIDEQKGLSTKAVDYYSKALTSPWGLKVKQFYTTTSKQVLDIHEEALRIADLHKPANTAAAATSSASTTNPPTEPTVQAPGSAGAGITGGPTDVKTTEAPTVV